MDIATSSRRPWATWADGQWWSVPGLALDRPAFVKFQNALYAWATRQHNLCASAITGENGAALFRIVPRAAGDVPEPELYAVLAPNMGGWLRLESGRLTFGSPDTATQVDRDAAEIICQLAETAWAGPRTPAAAAIPTADLYREPPIMRLRALAILADGAPVTETTVDRPEDYR